MGQGLERSETAEEGGAARTESSFLDLLFCHERLVVWEHASHKIIHVHLVGCPQWQRIRFNISVCTIINRIFPRLLVLFVIRHACLVL